MKLSNLFTKLTKPGTKSKGKKIVWAAVFALLVIFNLDQSIEQTQRFLTEEEQKIMDDFHDEELVEGAGIPFVSRFLSKNLGGGRCEWTAPDALTKRETDNTTTLLASYPGSGKRLAWRLLEALTGSVTGDEWDLSENGFHVLTMKTSYPHFEGPWTWGDHMDQMVMLMRNPLHAIPSYHTMRYELWFSSSWEQSYQRRNFTYTVRPGVEEWELWRDARFYNEMNRWGNFTDFWMMGGYRWNETFIIEANETTNTPKHTEWSYYKDIRCFNRTTEGGWNKTRLMDCTPKAVIQFEKLYSPDEATGIAEMSKLAAVLDNVQNVDMLDLEARPCIYKEVMRRTEFYNPNRNGKGPAPDTKKFTHTQLAFMIHKIEELQYKYSQAEWQQDPNAIVLREALSSYLPLVRTAYDTAVSEACEDDPEWYFNGDPGFSCVIMQRDMCTAVTLHFNDRPDGKTADSSCCVCGGGIYPNTQ